jgi:hypothetical protein
MALETKQVLITVKAYPNPSKKYGETVCCAGIDLETGGWVRLYPVPYRDLDSSQKFKKYTIINVRCRKAPDDTRAESFKIDSESIEIVRWLDTEHKWQSRRKIVIPTLSPSLCDMLQDAGDGRSLGVFRPREISFSWKKSASRKSDAERDACYAQLSFFDKQKNAIEEIPFDFYYHFRCARTEDCPGHKLSIIDWEIGQAYRDWRHKYSEGDLLLEKISQRWLTLMCSEDNDTCFYVGNMMRFRKQFMILGVFYPKK